MLTIDFSWKQPYNESEVMSNYVEYMPKEG